MFRPSSTARLARQSLQASRIIRLSNPSSRRFLTTEPPHKTSRSWKNSATRWAIAVAGIYWYNTSPLFAEEPRYTIQEQEAPLPTLDSLSRSSRFSLPSEQDPPSKPVQPTASSPPSIDPKSPPPRGTATQTHEPQSAEELESEASAQGAFNEETGEINWDCSCLGGMAYGPCGPEFREAFSCFVFSKEEPKGADCIDKFKGMQTCFRAHPEEYGEQLDDDDEAVEREIARQEAEDAAGADGVAGAEGAGIAAALKEEIKQDSKAGGVGKDASKALDKAEESKSPSKRSIYDSDDKSEVKSASKEGVETPKKSAGKSYSDPVQDGGSETVPKAAHDATNEGSK